MKAILSLLLLCSSVLPAVAQNDAAQPDEILESVQEWMQDNLDEDALDQLGVDQDRVRRFLAELRRRFHGTYVYDLGALRQTATNVLPVLQQFQETRPYAVWLESHLDYFEVAEELRRENTPSPEKPQPPRPPIPSPQLERSVWGRHLEKRPPPPLANECVPRLKRIFAAEKVPQELVWVAEVESSFNPAARSPAGAAGMFQLTPSTARALNLALHPADERLQTDKCARAAARHLRRLHDHFGDWRLALGAYNAGESRVDQLLRNSKSRTFDAIADRLPSETQMYVPKVEATLRRREEVTLSDLKF